MCLNRPAVLLIGFIKSLLKPSTVIAVAGPVILSVNRGHLFTNIRGMSVDLAQLSWVKTAVADLGAYALVEYNVQIYTLTLAWVFLQFEAAQWMFVALKHAIKNHQEPQETGKSILTALTVPQLVLLVALILQCGGVLFYLLLSGPLATPQIVALYRPDFAATSLHLPPLESLITWARAGVVVISMWISFRLNRDFHK